MTETHPRYNDGDTLLCRVCGWSIIYIDNRWMHVTKPDTHPATPDITTWQVILESHKEKPE